VVTPETEILTSAGLDAVVMTWTLKIGVSLFLPMAVIGCAVRERPRRAAQAGGRRQWWWRLHRRRAGF
jgi:hypothetical protein